MGPRGYDRRPLLYNINSSNLLEILNFSHQTSDFRNHTEAEFNEFEPRLKSAKTGLIEHRLKFFKFRIILNYTSTYVYIGNCVNICFEKCSILHDKITYKIVFSLSLL